MEEQMSKFERVSFVVSPVNTVASQQEGPGFYYMWGPFWVEYACPPCFLPQSKDMLISLIGEISSVSVSVRSAVGQACSPASSPLTLNGINLQLIEDKRGNE